MYSSEAETFKIKTEPLDEPADDVFDGATGGHNDSFTEYAVKMENLFGNEDFSMLERADSQSPAMTKMEIKVEPQDVLDESAAAQQECPMVSIPQDFSLPQEDFHPEHFVKEEPQESPKDEGQILICSVCNARYYDVKQFIKHHR